VTTLPTFITFTGADEWTDLDRMQALSRLYPIEWGILFSPKRQGVDPRYPPMTFVRKLIKHGPWPRLAAHLCGDYTLRVIDGHALPADLDEMLLYQVGRGQINGAPVHEAAKIAAWGQCRNLTPIMQCATAWPKIRTDTQTVEWLYDKSCGKGLVPASWPAVAPLGRRLGFAGGLGPDNVAQHVADIAGSRDISYWIDMESGIRDDDNNFSLDKCQAVCEAVYGVRT
jgi:hypothetical protein